MKRTAALRADPAKARAWQARGAQAYAARQREARRSSPAVDNPGDTAPQPRSKNVKPRRNDAGWRAECEAKRGLVCRGCGDTNHVQMDHIWPRSQGGPSVVENGLPLCGEFSRNTPGGCHPAKTAGRIVIEFSWLDPDQVAWLAAVGWVAWDADGQPRGRGWRHFGRRRTPTHTERVD